MRFTQTQDLYFFISSTTSNSFVPKKQALHAPTLKSVLDVPSYRPHIDSGRHQKLSPWEVVNCDMISKAGACILIYNIYRAPLLSWPAQSFLLTIYNNEAVQSTACPFDHVMLIASFP